LLAFHLAFGKTVADISLNAVANLGYADVRFLAPLYVATPWRRNPRSSAARRTATARPASSGCAPRR